MEMYIAAIAIAGGVVLLANWFFANRDKTFDLKYAGTMSIGDEDLVVFADFNRGVEFYIERRELHTALNKLEEMSNVRKD